MLTCLLVAYHWWMHLFCLVNTKHDAMQWWSWCLKKKYYPCPWDIFDSGNSKEVKLWRHQSRGWVLGQREVRVSRSLRRTFTFLIFEGVMHTRYVFWSNPALLPPPLPYCFFYNFKFPLKPTEWLCSFLVKLSPLKVVSLCRGPSRDHTRGLSSETSWQ